MRLRRALLVALALVVAVVGLVVKTVADAGALRTLAPHGLERCTTLEGLAGSEDIVFDASTGLVLVSSADFRHALSGVTTPGSILALDVAARRFTPVPHDFKGTLHPHGLGWFRPPEGPPRLFVVNHPTFSSSTVELFDVVDGPRLAHRRTVSAPEFISLNDVAPVGLEQFYVTLDAGTKNGTAARVAETFLRLPWAGVLFFDGVTAKQVASGMRYSNGVAATADTVFVTESSGRRLMAFARSPTNELTLLAELDAHTALDNISLGPDGALFIAGHPNMLAFLQHAKDASRLSPSQVLKARWDAAAKRFTLDELGVDDGALLSGSSVVTPIGPDRVLVGSVFSHVLDCPISP